MATTVTSISTGNRFVDYLADYASYHRTPGNKMTHHIGIPIITVAIVGVLSKVVLGPTFADGWFAWDLGFIAWIVVTAWYLYLDWKIGIPASLSMLACYLIGRPLPLVALVVLFVVGWVIQFIGHIKYEHNKPAFFKNFEHLLIGPVWIFGAWFRFLPTIPTGK